MFSAACLTGIERVYRITLWTTQSGNGLCPVARLVVNAVQASMVMAPFSASHGGSLLFHSTFSPAAQFGDMAWCNLAREMRSDRGQLTSRPWHRLPYLKCTIVHMH